MQKNEPLWWKKNETSFIFTLESRRLELIAAWGKHTKNDQLKED